MVQRGGTTGTARCSACPLRSHLPLTVCLLPWSFPASKFPCALHCVSQNPLPAPEGNAERRGAGCPEPASLRPSSAFGQRLRVPLAQRVEFAGAQPRVGGVGATVGLGGGPSLKGTLGSTRRTFPRAKISLRSSYVGRDRPIQRGYPQPNQHLRRGKRKCLLSPQRVDTRPMSYSFSPKPRIPALRATSEASNPLRCSPPPPRLLVALDEPGGAGE